MKICKDCGTTKGLMHNSKKYNAILCDSCYQFRNRTPNLIIHELPPKGEVRYDKEGKPICHICGKSFKKLMSHVYQKHDMTEREYKKEFGLDLIKGILCQSTKEKLQKSVSENYDLVVKNNLIKHGEDTRFEKGEKGRTRDKISLQTMKRLKQSSFIKNNIDRL